MMKAKRFKNVTDQGGRLAIDMVNHVKEMGRHGLYKATFTDGDGQPWTIIVINRTVSDADVSAMVRRHPVYKTYRSAIKAPQKTIWPHPGEIIDECRKDFGLTITDLSGLLSVSGGHLSRVIAGSRPVTDRLAINLARVFETSADYWMNLQSEYNSRNNKTS